MPLSTDEALIIILKTKGKTTENNIVLAKYQLTMLNEKYTPFIGTNVCNNAALTKKTGIFHNANDTKGKAANKHNQCNG